MAVLTGEGLTYLWSKIGTFVVNKISELAASKDLASDTVDGLMSAPDKTILARLNTEAVLKSTVKDALNDVSTDLPLSANQGYILNTNKVNKSGDTLIGPLVANSNTNYTTKQVRNIIISTANPTSTDGANGDIFIKYTV